MWFVKYVIGPAPFLHSLSPPFFTLSAQRWDELLRRREAENILDKNQTSQWTFAISGHCVKSLFSLIHLPGLSLEVLRTFPQGPSPGLLVW